MFKKIFSHTAIYGLAPQVSKIAYFLALPFITPYLTEFDFGVSGIMLAYTSAISILSTLGLNVILTNIYYKSPFQYKWAWRQIYGFLTLWNIVYAIILAILLYFVIPKGAEENKWHILLLNVLPFVFFGQTAVIGNLFFRLKQFPLQIATRTIIFGITNVVLSVILIKHFKMGYMGWFWATFISTMLNNLSYWYVLNFKFNLTPIFNYKWRYVKKSLKISLPTIPHYYSGYLLGNSDKMVMTFYSINTNNIGKYNFANIIGNVFQTLVFATGTAIGPILNELFKKKEDLNARNIIFTVQSIFFLLTFCFSIWTKNLFEILIKNENLSNTYPIAIILIMSYNYRPMYMGANMKIFYEEKTKSLWKVSFIAGILNIGMNLVLLPIAGYKVAAITTFISLMYMGYSGYFLKVNSEISNVNYHPIKWLFATISLTILSYFAVELPFWYKLPITFICILTSAPFIYKLVIKINKIK